MVDVCGGWCFGCLIRFLWTILFKVIKIYWNLVEGYKRSPAYDLKDFFK